MSSSSQGASVPHNPNIEWALQTSPPEPDVEEPSDLEHTSNEEYDHVYGPAIEAKDRNKPTSPAQVEDQFTHPTEDPEGFNMENIKSQGINGFMTKVTNRLRTLNVPDERSRARHAFLALMVQLRVDYKARPAYNQTAAEQIQQLLVDRGLGETLLLDFNLLLDATDERARKYREETERRKQELQREKRKKQEWDIVRKEDADDEWEIL